MNPLEIAFPNLLATGYRITSPTDPFYNCAAWAVAESDRWWWPDSMEVGYWPASVPREETMDAFIKAFATLGFAPVANPLTLAGKSLVALYAKAGVPTHVCRQLPSGFWTSKLGIAEDIEHTLDGLSGAIYGTVALILERIE